MTSGGAAARIAAHFNGRFLRSYVRAKLASDPLYEAVGGYLSGRPEPVADVGCGVGLMAFWLRELGFAPDILGIDHDERKIDVARRIAGEYANLTFVTGDARMELPAGHNILLLDLLHYFGQDDQLRILRNAAGAVARGGVVVIRDGIRDGSWRYRATRAAEVFARGVRWLRAERLNFPTRDLVLSAFPGFEMKVEPLRGRTPFNNYLFVLKRSGEGTTNV